MLNPAPEVAAVLQLVITGFLLLAGAFVLVRRAASRYFVASFAEDYGAPPEGQRSMSIGGGGGGEGVCVVCGEAGTKKCSRCKSARYCSQACQSKHWKAGHKLKCKQMSVLDTLDTSSVNSPSTRRRSSGFHSISLVPAHGSCKVLQEPKKILFSYAEFVKLFNWDKPGFIPCGLLNCGNSCFANVVLQCLACTQPLTAYLLERDHSRLCIRKQDDWCFLCELQVHIQRARESLHPFAPLNILSRLPNIGGNLGYGRQEDAHEFMRFAIDTMQSICLDEFGGEKALDSSSQETTLIQYIFGGYLRSQVICTECNMVSNRYENMMDLTVEIQGDAGSLEKCLHQFTVKEWLDGENMYKCDGCNDYVKAWKRLTVHQAPNILTIALKRFQGGRFGKLNKRVAFPEVLDLTPYMSGNGDGTDLYTLYAVVVHVDMLNASFFGHYICYTKDSYGRWYRIDDSKVMNVEVEEVLAQHAYMLLYSRKNARQEPFIKPMESASKTHSPKTEPMPLTLSTAANHNSLSDCPTVSDDPQPEVLLHKEAMDASLLSDSGHERESSIIVDVLKEKEPEGMVVDAPESSIIVDAIQETGPGSTNMVEVLEVNSMPVYKDSDVHMDNALVTLAGGKELELENPNLSACATEDTVPVELIHSDSIAPVKISNSEVPLLGSEAPNFTSGPDCQMEENNGLISIMERCTSDNSSSSVSISITSSSQLEEPLVDLRLKLEQPAVACKPSDLSNGVVSWDTTSLVNRVKESKFLASRQVESLQKNSKPLFSRGFLDTPARKRCVVHVVRTQTEEHVGLATKVNGYVNGHLDLGFAQNVVHDISQNSGDMLGYDDSLHFCSFTNKFCGNSSNEDMVFGNGLDKMGHTHCKGSAEWASCQNGSKDCRLEAGFLNGGKSSSDCEQLSSSHSFDNIPGDKSDEFHDKFGGTDIKSNNKGACHTVLENGYDKISNGCLGYQLDPVDMCLAKLGSLEQFNKLVTSGFSSHSIDCGRQVPPSDSLDNVPAKESGQSEEELGGSDIEINNKMACCTNLENGFDKCSNVCLGNNLEPVDRLHLAGLGGLEQSDKLITSDFTSYTIYAERQLLSSNSLNSIPDELD